jgi:hypothetical protein
MHTIVSVLFLRKLSYQMLQFVISVENYSEYSWRLGIVDILHFPFCRRLTELVVKYCQNIGDSAFLEIGNGCTQLQALHLVDCSSISDAAICYIAKGCRDLKKLHVRRCYKVFSITNVY